MFYHAFSRDRIKGDDIEVNFPAVQTVDPANATAHLTKQNMWVSPKIEFANGIKYGDANKTAIQFVSLNAILKLNISNKSDNGALVVNKVEVVGTTGAFPVKANVDLASGEGVSDPALDPSSRTYADDLDQAITAGYDAFVTGEIGHEQYHVALESKINVIAGGHYQTETIGVQQVMQKLQQEMQVETLFIDVPTGL